MSNTKLRIISAFVMITLVVTCVAFGKIPTLVLSLLVGILCIDELLINFEGLFRKNLLYKSIIFFFALLFIAINMLSRASYWLSFFNITTLLFDFFLMYYLFQIPLKDEFMKKSTLKYPGMLSIVGILPFLSLGIHFRADLWRQYLSLLMVVTYSMDSGAWFFGKNFGKRKLWPEVSPKKTIEGLFGGMLTAGLCGSLCWYYFFHDYRWYSLVIFAGCGAISQVGDLIQSKIKREFGIKDSSQLIPGHGGIYDRIDSLIFLSPFFVIVVKYLGYQVHL